MLDSNLRYSEQERIAYISGNAMLAEFCAHSEDLEGEIDGFDDRLEAEYSRGYDEGARDTLGEEVADKLVANETEISRLKTEHKALRTLLQLVQGHLDGDMAKKAAGRLDLSKHITRQLIQTPRY